MTPTAAFFFFLLYRFVLVVGVIFWCERVYPEGGGGGYSLIFALYTSALPQRFLRCFGLKTVIDFAYFCLNSVLVFEGIRECLEVFVVSTLNE